MKSWRSRGLLLLLVAGLALLLAASESPVGYGQDSSDGQQRRADSVGNPSAEVSPPPAKSEPSNSDRSSTAAGPPKIAEEPPLYYVRDKDGHLVPLLGFTYEDIQQLWK